ncbi:MAG TPA: Cof-type HAD-IIB family hydrolase [Ruminiclostridium sp.]|jgi:Cof subfamily protein (haloacid dehalogenase superfamily)|nr:HAD family phosphatase [Clostridiaceae bacterium]HAA24964.1 Cof-type HAD-IIB family hydrolase [Ruminiclostridium sp.]
MKYKLLAVDVDGTLLNSRREITMLTKQSIQKAIEKGIVFTICSGRPVQGVKLITDMLEIDIPVITYNGAMVIVDDKVIFSCTMQKEDVLHIERLGQEWGTTIAIWAGNRLFVNKLNERALKYAQISGVSPQIYTDVMEPVSMGVSKVLWYDEIERINGFERRLNGLLSPSVNVHTSQPIFLEFVDRNVSKAVALEKMGEHYGIRREEMIAVGDGFNDLAMIEYAGLGVAMGNAPEEVKNAADYITFSNDEDGVAKVIEVFVLNQQRSQEYRDA